MEATELAFAAHFYLVTIHPFYDGKGRTSRLLINYIQAYYSIFQKFMKGQYEKQLEAEINAYRRMRQHDELKPRPGKGRGYSLFF